MSTVQEDSYAIRWLIADALKRATGPARCKQCAKPVRLCECGEWPTTVLGRRQYLQEYKELSE